MFVTSAVAAGIGCFAAWFASSTYDSCSAYIMVMMLPVCMSTAHIVMCVWGLSSLQLNGNTVLSITALSCSNSGVPKVCYIEVVQSDYRANIASTDAVHRHCPMQTK